MHGGRWNADIEAESAAKWLRVPAGTTTQRQVAVPCGDRRRTVDGFRPTGHAHHLGVILGARRHVPGVLAWAVSSIRAPSSSSTSTGRNRATLPSPDRAISITSAVRRGAGASAGSDMP